MLRNAVNGKAHMRTLFQQAEREHGAVIPQESRRESDTAAATEQDTRQQRVRGITSRRTALQSGRETKTVMPILGSTAVVLALNIATFVACDLIRLHYLPPGQKDLTMRTFEEAYRWIDPLKWGTWVIALIFIIVAASYFPPRVARWGVGIANLLYYLSITTEYSLTASPIWVLSRSQLTGWGYAVLAAVTTSVAQIMAAEQLARWRTRRKPGAVAVLAPASR